MEQYDKLLAAVSERKPHILRFLFHHLAESLDDYITVAMSVCVIYLLEMIYIKYSHIRLGSCLLGTFYLLLQTVLK